VLGRRRLAAILLTVDEHGAPFTVMLEGGLDQVGGVTSLTVTVNEAVPVFPAASCKLTSKGIDKQRRPWPLCVHWH
jgi:hypothetical protein